MFMKSAFALKISLFIIVLGLLTSCAPSSQVTYRGAPQAIYKGYSRATYRGAPPETSKGAARAISRKAEMIERCSFENIQKVNYKRSRKIENPPTRVTPIGANYSIRH